MLARRDDEDGKLFLASLGEGRLNTVEAFETIVAHNQSAPEGVRLYSVLLGESLEVDHPAHDISSPATNTHGTTFPRAYAIRLLDDSQRTSQSRRSLQS